MFAAAFERMAVGLATAMGGPYHPARVLVATPSTLDEGGSILTPGDVEARNCMVQVDTATEAMRAAEGYTEKDVRLFLIGLEGGLTTDARVEVAAGPGAGIYAVQSVTRDTAGVGFEARGRRWG